MKRILYLTAMLFSFFVGQSFAQSKQDLKRQLEQIVSGKKAVVGVSVHDSKGQNVVSLNENRRFPMQSVFKFHIGLLVLSEVDKGKSSLEQKIKLTKADMIPEIYSPLRDKYPDGVTLTLGEILQYTISVSDNTGCEYLLDNFGGTSAVENYFKRNKIKDISIKHNEKVMQSNWDLQFDNWTTPNAGNKVLRAFYENKNNLLAKSSYDFFWKVMRETSTGVKRIKGALPENTVVAHKTGSSGVNQTTGITAAVNDMGVVFLPDGKHFFITVFVTDSKENAETNEKIIADISKAAWDYFVRKS